MKLFFTTPKSKLGGKHHEKRCRKLNKTKSPLLVIAGALLAVAAMAATATQASAQDDSTKVRFQPFEAVGYQADSSSPLVFQGRPIGKNAIWQVLVGPLESSAFATIPSASDPAGFGGAVCAADYSQAELVTEDGSTLTVNVYGFRCEPSDPAAATAPGAHFKSGVYSVVGGTGAFKKVGGGTGSISFDAPGDGSVYVNITGFLKYPNSPI
jgi:hypothetical protein